MSSSPSSPARSATSNSTLSSSVVDASGRILSGKYLEKATSKKDLILRLRKILRLLRDDDNIEPDSYEYPGLAALCHSLTRYVNHRDKEVRLLCCAACMELFTIYAPEAPWNEVETIDIFTQTIRQLANLAHSTGVDSHGSTNAEFSSSSGPHFYQYYRILELLAEVKIAVVLVDLSKKNDDIIDNDGDSDGDSDEVGDESIANETGGVHSDSDISDSVNAKGHKDDKIKNSCSSRRRHGNNAAEKIQRKNKAEYNINHEALQTLSELFRTLLQSVRNSHPSEISDFCQKTLTSCVEEFFESTILPVPILDEILVCIGQGPRVLVLQQQKQSKVSRQCEDNKKTKRKRKNINTNSASPTTTTAPAVSYVQQNNPSYMVASAVIRASVERLSTPIASLLNGLVNSDPRWIEKSTISNHIVCENDDDDLDSDEKDTDNVSEKVLAMTLNLGKPQRQKQDVHGSSNVYSVILELQRVAPAILTTVIGNLSSHVETLDADHRCLVVHTLGKLFAGSDSGRGNTNKGSSSSDAVSNNENFTVAYQYNPCFRKWLARSNDCIADIRKVMLPHLISLTKTGSGLLRNGQSSTSSSSSSPQVELAREVQDVLIVRLTKEPSKELSLQVIQELCNISYYHRKVISRSLLDQVGLKVLSKEKLERKQALTGLVHLYFRQYIKIFLSTVEKGGDDCPIEAVLQVLNNCCRSSTSNESCPSKGNPTSLIAARCKETSSASILSPQKTPKKKKSARKKKGSGKRSRRRARSSIVSDDDDDEFDDEDNVQGTNFHRRNNAYFNDDDDFTYYQWIPCVLFESTSYTDAADPEMRSRVFQLMDELILGSSSPHPDNHRHLTSTSRATGFAVIVDAVRNQSRSAWNGMLILQSARAKLQATLRSYLDARADIRNHETGSEEHFVADAKAKDLLEKVSNMIPPPTGSAPVHGQLHSVLDKFHSIKDKHIFRILGTITNPSHSVKARARALDDLPKRVKSTAGDAVHTWVKSLVKRSAMGDFINHDTIHHCVLLAQECLQDEEFEATEKFLACVQLAAESFPLLCAEGDIFENLTEIFRECNSISLSSSDQKSTIEQTSIITTVSSILASVSPYRSLAGGNVSDLSLEEDFHKKLITLCRDGNPEQARHAVATMAALSKAENGVTLTQKQTDSSLSLLNTLATPSRLAIASAGSSAKLVCVLVALSELADHAPKVFESSSRGMSALKFALEMVLMGRAHSSSKNDDDGSFSSEDETDMEETKTPKRAKKEMAVNKIGNHLSPTATGGSLVEDENLSISCRTLCAAIELLATYIRSSVFTAKKTKSVLPKESVDLIGKVFDILSQILRDQGLPPSTRDRKMCSLRQDRAALRQCAAIHLFRLCDTRLGLDQSFLTTQKWHILASILLDDELIVRKAVIEELGLMLTGTGKYSTRLGMTIMAPRLRFVAMSVFCVDGSHGSHSRGNGNAKNIGGKCIRNQRGNTNGCIDSLRKVYEFSAAQYRAQGPGAERQFETSIKPTVMPEYAVPYAYHLLTYRHETPSNIAGTGNWNTNRNDDEDEFEIDEGGQKVLKKRLKALYDPLVLQLGVSADNISFLLRMAEVLAKSFKPLGIVGRDEGKKDRDKLINICTTAREVLLSYVKTDANLDTHPGDILMPGNLFRKLENRKRSAKSMSPTIGSPILEVMLQKENQQFVDNDSRSKTRKASRQSREMATRKSPKNDVPGGNYGMQMNDDDDARKISNEGKVQQGHYDIGAGIKKKFGDKFYVGRVTHYDANSGLYQIEYDDGDKEELDHDEVKTYHIQNDIYNEGEKSRRFTRSSSSDQDSDYKSSSECLKIKRSDSNPNMNGKGTTQNPELSQSSKDTESVVTNQHDDPSLESKIEILTGKRKSSMRPETPRGSSSIDDSRVHFSPDVDFGAGLSPSPIRRDSGNDRTLLSSAETKTRGTTPPSDLRFTATASIALASSAAPDARTFDSPTPVSESFASTSSNGRKPKQDPGEKKKATRSSSRSKRAMKNIGSNGKENQKTTGKKKHVPRQIKIVRSPHVQKKIRRNKHGRKNTQKNMDSFEFDG